jgi:hypothetical protein
MIRDLGLDYDANEGGETAFLTLTTPEVLIQVALEPGELALLSGVPDTDWTQRRTVRAGTCSGRQVHWFVAEPPAAAVMSVGDDAETAQVSLALSSASLQRLLALASSTH